MSAAATGNDAKASKMQKKKTNLALAVAVGVGALGALIYVVVRNRAAIQAGGAAAVKAMGPLVNRVLPALALGAISMIAGPEGVFLGVPVGAIFGPALIQMIAGGGTDGATSTALASQVFPRAALSEAAAAI